MAVSLAWYAILIIKGVAFGDALSLLNKAACWHLSCVMPQVMGGRGWVSPRLRQLLLLRRRGEGALFHLCFHEFSQNVAVYNVDSLCFRTLHILGQLGVIGVNGGFVFQPFKPRTGS